MNVCHIYLNSRPSMTIIGNTGTDEFVGRELTASA